MEKAWTEDYEVKFYEVDFRKKLKITNIFLYMQETAHKHTAGTDIGYENLIKYNMFWALTRIKIKMIRVPLWKENIRVKTWAKKTNKMFAIREFKMFDSEDKLIGTATSDWMLVNVKTRKPVKISLLPTPIPTIENEYGIDETLSKIKVEGKIIDTYNKVVVYSDIDVNKHVNNAKYIDWILDCLTEEDIENNKLDHLQFNFINEAKYSDKININKIKSDEHENRLYFEGINTNVNNKIFQAVLVYNKII